MLNQKLVFALLVGLFMTLINGCGKTNSPGEFPCGPGGNCATPDSLTDGMDADTAPLTDANSEADTPDGLVQESDGEGGENSSDTLPSDTAEVDTAEPLETDSVEPEDSQDVQELAPGTCLIATDCPGLQLCDNELCIEPLICTSSLDCLDDFVCDGGHCSESYSQCSDNSDCEQGVCSPLTHECQNQEPCTADQDCLGYQVCSSGACIECLSSSTCPSPAMTCYEKQCMEPFACTSGADCLPGKQCIAESCAYPNVESDSLEPNNTLASASEIEDEVLDLSLTLSTYDVDTFVISVPSGRGLLALLNFETLHGEREVTLTDISGYHVLDSIPSTDSYGVLSLPLLDTNRSYILTVRQESGITPTYSLTTWYTKKDFCIDDDLEGETANNQPGDATPISSLSGSSPTGIICGNDPDWFRFEVKENETAVVALSHASDLGALRIRLYDESISLVEESDAPLPTLAIISETLEPGEHFIQIESTNGGSNAYDLEVKTFSSLSCTLDELEFNDSPLSASPVPGGSVQVTLCPEDEDWFYVEVPPEQGIEATLAYSNVNSQLVVEILAEDGSTLLAQDPGTLFPKGSTIQTAKKGKLDVGEGVYIHVRRDSETPVSTFTPYTLTVSVVDGFCVDDPNEDNDSVDEATPALTFLGLYNEGISCEEDLDWYSFNLSENQAVSIDLRGAEKGSSPLLLLVGSDGINALPGVQVQAVGDLGHHVSFFTDDLSEFTPGPVYALVTEGSDTGYKLVTLTQTLPNNCTDDVWEPNNTLLGSVAFPPTLTLSGAFCPNNPDFFMLPSSEITGSPILNVEIPEENQKVTLEAFDSSNANLATWILNESDSVTLPSPEEGNLYLRLLSPYSTEYSLTIEN